MSGECLCCDLIDCRQKEIDKLTDMLRILCAANEDRKKRGSFVKLPDDIQKWWDLNKDKD